MRPGAPASSVPHVYFNWALLMGVTFRTGSSITRLYKSFTRLLIALPIFRPKIGSALVINFCEMQQNMVLSLITQYASSTKKAILSDGHCKRIILEGSTRSNFVWDEEVAKLRTKQVEELFRSLLPELRFCESLMQYGKSKVYRPLKTKLPAMEMFNPSRSLDNLSGATVHTKTFLQILVF